MSILLILLFNIVNAHDIYNLSIDEFDYLLGYNTRYSIIRNIYNHSIRDFDRFLGYNNSFEEPDYRAIEILARQIIEYDNNTLIKENIRDNHLTLPSMIDYRNTEQLSSVKFQGSCGTCVAFAAIGVQESEYLKHGIDIDLSEKYLYFCNSNRDCNDGWNLHSVTYTLLTNGVVSEHTCPYNSLAFICHESCQNNNKYKITNYKYIDNFYDMRKWLHENGTLLTRVNVYSDLYYYRHGIYSRETDNYRGAHALAVVGYNDIEQYWIAKNSWGDDWGLDGYIHIKYGESGMMPYAYGYEVETIVPPYVSGSSVINIHLYLLFTCIYYCIYYLIY
tara:strand:+ start:11100 stop:12098 length:999 start_codon:yes stop_codon:yes gene_type:complete